MFSLCAPRAGADERIRPKSPEQIKDAYGKPAEKQNSFRVVGARASYVNFAAIRRDFPGLKEATDQQVEKWVLENFAYISEPQLSLNGIRNGEVPIDRTQTKADYRPSGYNRAGVLEAMIDGKPVGAVDIKGLGHREDGAKMQVKEFEKTNGDPKAIDELRAKDHSDGLMRHGEAIAELTRQTALQRLYDLYNHQHGTDYQTVETYFVIEMPFDVLGPNGKRERAALYGRQAHWRGHSSKETPKGTYEDYVGGRQASVFRSAVDFGGVIIEDPRLKENFRVKDGGRPVDPQDTHAWEWAHQTADAFARGDTRAVYNHLADMVRPIDAAWRALPPPGPPGEGEQKQFLDVLDRLRHANETTDAWVLAERINKLLGEREELAEMAMEAMSPQTIERVFTQRELLQSYSLYRLVNAFQPTSPAGNDPKLKALITALGKGANDPKSNFYERSRPLTVLGDLVRKNLPADQYQSALRPVLTEFVQTAMKAYEESPTREARLLALTEVARAGITIDGYWAAVEKVLLDQVKNENVWRGRATDLIFLLCKNLASPELDAVFLRLYPKLDIGSRLSVADYLVRREVPGAAAVIRGNIRSDGKYVSEALVRQVLRIPDAANEAWIVGLLNAEKDPREFEALWRAAREAKIPDSVLATTVVRALSKLTVSDALGVAMIRVAREQQQPGTEAATEQWLRRLGGRGRDTVCFISQDPWLTETAKKLGVRFSCRDAWNYVSTKAFLKPAGVIGSVSLAAVGLLAYSSRMHEERENACLERQGKLFHDSSGAWTCRCQDGKPITEGTCDERNQRFTAGPGGRR